VIGNPGESSPVFVTGNYLLTVTRVKRALRGIDCYLIVARSGGVNVWCAAAGGLLTNASMIEAINKFAPERKKQKKEVILPQLMASRIEAKTVKKKTGWGVTWGPVYASDIPAFLGQNGKKTAGQRKVKFTLPTRLEMGAAWAFPVSFLTAIVTLILWKDMLLPFVALVWLLTLGLFISFPLYSRYLKARGLDRVKRRQTVFRICLWVFLMIAVLVYARLVDRYSPGFVIASSVAMLLISIAVTIDTLGFAPGHKGSLHPDRLNRVVVEKRRCTGCGVCVDVCPGDCFEILRKKAVARRYESCVQCGACVIQCPTDCLFFETPAGEKIPPSRIRRYKMNIAGHREVDTKNNPKV
jgi:NAD-dependent dihydropyrimidine dehydrogenase PreA subunit